MFSYSLRQILSVVLITFGIILCTYASSQSLNKEKQAKNLPIDEPKFDFIRWTVGIGMLVFALLVSALMGIYQEKLYAQYGKYPEEALFYSVRFSFKKEFFEQSLTFSMFFHCHSLQLLVKASINPFSYSINQVDNHFLCSLSHSHVFS